MLHPEIYATIFSFFNITICHTGISHEHSTDMTPQQRGIGIMVS